MDAVMVFTAFIFGFLVKQIGLPPLLGFLTAGFVLHAFGIQSDPQIELVANIGILLLLFSIGLKVKVKSLLRAEIWGVAAGHMLITVALFGTFIALLSYTGLALFTALSWQISLLIAFALSFSSTVFTVKVLEEKGELSSKHGQVAIGILILQDFFAVIFLTLSSGKIPSPWAIALIGLLLLKKPILAILKRCGHGELLVLVGLLIPLGTAALFDSLGVKADLGALLIGMLLAGDKKGDELAGAILNFKDLLLVGFFLTIGLAGLPTLETITIALLFTIAVPIKGVLFHLLFNRCQLRARTSLLSSLSLTTYSEFGLIIGAMGAAKGWISNEWLIIFALALSFSFIFAAQLNKSAHYIYNRIHVFLKRMETKDRLEDEQIVSVGNVDVLVFGMGRVGVSAYQSLQEKYGKRIIAVDSNLTRVKKHATKGFNIIHGDATDHDFWERVQLQDLDMKLIMLTIENFEANLLATQRIREQYAEVTIAAIVAFDDQIILLKEAGADLVFDVNMEAGKGFADHICERTGSAQTSTTT